jgi:hypothetical protein
LAEWTFGFRDAAIELGAQDSSGRNPDDTATGGRDSLGIDGKPVAVIDDNQFSVRIGLTPVTGQGYGQQPWPVPGG